MYNSIYSRIIDYCIGLSLGKIHLSNQKIKIATFQEFLSITLIIALLLASIPFCKYSFILLLCTYLIYVYSFKKGFLSKILVKNTIIDYICQYSFNIYLFHYILLMYSHSSHWSTNLYFDLISVLTLIFISSSLTCKFKQR